MCYFLLGHAASFWRRSLNEIGFFFVAVLFQHNEQASNEQVLDEVFADKDSDYSMTQMWKIERQIQ